MTDITALMATMKAAAEKASDRGELIVQVNTGNVLALVEALEATEKTSAARKEAIERTHKMFQRERDRADAAEQRIAELESRTVTVKLPEVSDDAFWMSAYGRLVFREETYRSAVVNAMCNAGIQVIEGGE